MEWIAVTACVVATTCLSLTAANATETQVWVSNSGKDTGSCLKTDPCATFQYAYEHVPTNGAINVADSGSYGPIDIKKSISIIAADGVDALIGVAPDSTGINVQTTGLVLLKGLHIAGQEIANNYGIVDTSAHVVIDHVTVTNLQYGVSVSGGVGSVLPFAMIRNSLFFGNVSGIACPVVAPPNGAPYFYFCNIFVGQTTVSGNEYGVLGPINSYGDNDMNGNTQCDVCDAIITEVSHDR